MWPRTATLRVRADPSSQTTVLRLAEPESRAPVGLTGEDERHNRRASNRYEGRTTMLANVRLWVNLAAIGVGLGIAITLAVGG